MKRIDVLVKGVSENVKAQFKVKRINKAVESAMLNAQEDLETAKQSLEEFSEKAKDMDAETIVSKLFELLGVIEDNEAIITRLEKVKTYLNEEEEVNE